MLALGLALTVSTGLFVAAKFALVHHDHETVAERGEKRLGQMILALRITSPSAQQTRIGRAVSLPCAKN